MDTRLVINKKNHKEERNCKFRWKKQKSLSFSFFFVRKLLGKTSSFPQKPIYQKHFCRPTTVDDGSHNVSRWMTWLPISLKNAAKCDKWYQLQNLSITESLNANGTWKKILVVQLQVCHDLSVEQKPRKKTRFFSGRFCAWVENLKNSSLGAVASIKKLYSPLWVLYEAKNCFFSSSKKKKKQIFLFFFEGLREKKDTHQKITFGVSKQKPKN